MANVGSLEVDQQLGFQRRSWLVQRIGWFVMAAISAAALAGYVGDGPASAVSQSSSDDSLRVEFQRYLRHQSPSQLRFVFTAEAIEDGEVDLALNRDYLDRFELSSIVPEPDSATTSTDETTYTFKADGPGEITIHVHPEGMGFATAHVRAGDAKLTFEQFVYP